MASMSTSYVRSIMYLGILLLLPRFRTATGLGPSPRQADHNQHQRVNRGSEVAGYSGERVAPSEPPTPGRAARLVLASVDAQQLEDVEGEVERIGDRAPGLEREGGVELSAALGEPHPAGRNGGGAVKRCKPPQRG